MIQTMKTTRKAVIRKLMLNAQDESIDVNDILRAIKAFDQEAMDAFEAVNRWQEVCFHFDDTPFKPFLSIETGKLKAGVSS
jgi:hypothetical protein